MLEKLKNFRWGYLFIAALIAAIGVCFIVWHDTIMYLAIAIGVITIVFGIIYFVINISSKDRGALFAIRTVISICCIISGVMTAIFNEGSIPILVSLISLFLIIDGSFKLNTTAMSRRYHLLLWWFILVPAILVIIGAFFALRMSDTIDLDNIKTPSILIGITMLVDALSNILSAFYISRFEKNMAKEISEEVAAAKAEAAKRREQKAKKKAEKEAAKAEKERLKAEKIKAKEEAKAAKAQAKANKSK